MPPRQVDAIYFSPTGTTRGVVEAVLNGMDCEREDLHDVTLPRAAIPRTLEGDAVVLAAPVYGGRLPPEAVRRFSSLEGRGQPTAVIVVYGNRAFEDALLELKNLAVARNLQPVAAAAFIGEHSFSSGKVQIAPGRPDAHDQELAQSFGETFVRRTETGEPVFVPGNQPYRNYAVLPSATPTTIERLCTNCGRCAARCPTGAIDLNRVPQTAGDKCILCCACVKQCTRAARIMNSAALDALMERLSLTCTRRKEPTIYV